MRMHLRRRMSGAWQCWLTATPKIFPVNYAVDESGDIFFRTDPGSKLDAVATAPTIAFEIDGLDEERQSGWSVLAVGPTRWIVGAEQRPTPSPSRFSRGLRVRRPTWSACRPPSSPAVGSTGRRKATVAHQWCDHLPYRRGRSRGAIAPCCSTFRTIQVGPSALSSRPMILRWQSPTSPASLPPDSASCVAAGPATTIRVQWMKVDHAACRGR